MEGGGGRRGGDLETCFNRSERVSTGCNMFRHVQTGLDRSERVPTGFNGLVQHLTQTHQEWL